MPKLDILSHVKVASPCLASWAQMRGDERVRFCEQCKLNVYNLSEMSHTEAEQLILTKEGRLCVRYYQRPDGTILTQNCPVGLRRARRALAKLIGGIAAGFAFLAASLGALTKGPRGSQQLRLRYFQPFTRIMEWISPSYIGFTQLMGDGFLDYPSSSVPLEQFEAKKHKMELLDPVGASQLTERDVLFASDLEEIEKEEEKFERERLAQENREREAWLLPRKSP